MSDELRQCHRCTLTVAVKDHSQCNWPQCVFEEKDKRIAELGTINDGARKDLVSTELTLLAKERKIAKLEVREQEQDRHIDRLITQLRKLESDRQAALDGADANILDWVLSLGFATGHADTTRDLLDEVGAQVRELQAKVRELEAEVTKWKLEGCKWQDWHGEEQDRADRLETKVRELEEQNAALSDAEVKRFAAYEESEHLQTENAELRAALGNIMKYPEIREYVGSILANAATDALRQRAGQESEG